MTRALESVAIRRAGAGDYAELARVELESSVQGPRDWAALNSGDHFIYLAEDARVFGFVCAGAPLVDVGIPSCGEIIGWYLRTSHQGYGMGKKLLVRGLSVLKRRHFETALIWLTESQVQAHGVLASLDFKSADLSRITNSGSTSITEQGYRLSLDAWF